MKTAAATFKTSVNIKFDLGKKEFVDRYLPTPSHAESLLGLLRGFNDPLNNKRSHIIVGPYGTGKSLVATIIGNIASKRIDNSTYKSLLGKFNKVHGDIYQELQKTKDIEKKYLTVVLNGNEGRFREAILTAIIKTINENNINIVLPGQYGKIIDTINLWENHYPKTYKEFKKKLKDSNKDLNIWRIAIMNQDKYEVDWFLSIYPDLTSGASFTIDFNESFINQIISVLDELNNQNLGLFIAYDEFGRLLQTLESRDIHDTMQDLQDLAELADHYNDNLHILLITHRNLRQYFNFLNEEYKNEFQRIEKRFKVYNVESDKSTFVRLADNIIQNLKTNSAPDNAYKYEINQYLRKYPLFPELNQQEIERIIVEGIYPLHPVALYLLPYLSSNHGQNERTLFTFLESNETGGLLNHLYKTKQYYLAANLFTYFFPNLHDVDTNKDELKDLRVYKSLISKTPEILTDNNALSLVKVITLWQLAGLQSSNRLDTDFLCFALDMSLESITKLLTKLSLLKIIRFNRVLGYWELLEGSSFHIDQLINDHEPQLSITKQKQMSVLENCLPKHFFFANEYNDRKSITRYANVKFIASSEIINDNSATFIDEDFTSDATVFYVLLESSNEFSPVLEKLKQVQVEPLLFCISRLPYTAIEDQLREYFIIKTLLNNDEILSEDKNLRQELLLKKEDLNFVIEDFLSKYVSYDSDTIWMHKGEIIDVTSEILLENKLSDIMFHLFPHTPEVRNDSFNRKRLNNVQKKAGQIVLDHLINDYNKRNLGIEGHGPDYLIYATVLKNNNLDITNLNEIKSNEYSILRTALVNHLEHNTKGTLQDFVNIMVKPPFGIREPLIPIYLVSLLRDKWDHFMFYRNDLFVSGINGEKLFMMFYEAREYKYIYYNFNNEFQKFFQMLEKEFGSYENELIRNKPIVIRLNNALLSWLRGLPRITQTTVFINKELITLKDTIRRSEINPQESLTKLFELYKDDAFQNLLEKKSELENHFYAYKDELKNQILSITKQEDFNRLVMWAEVQPPKVKKQNSLVKSILHCLSEDTWLCDFAFNYVGVEIEDWSDKTKEVFENQIASDFKATLEQDREQENHHQITYNGKVKTVNKTNLSKKSETIYMNVERMIRNAGRNVTKDEIECLVLKLVDEFIE
ncbi:hypothetical protein [Bacillus sp. SJS]|uniref:hypothetical protein n=1 Tax=Bacillus sp. SJS TaxID=1423321 RepID=UPI0004DD8824|nr:hypothetical protein [Bacillus sp. SJS]KZZ84381.1 hypothetical protein AS29_011005 [Bacillus sp. SJS]